MQQGDWLGNAWQSTVIIDAGSTGSRIHIYQYKVSRAGLAVVRQPVSSLKVTPGLSAYAVQPKNVGESLGLLLEYAYKQVWRQHLHRKSQGVRMATPRQLVKCAQRCRVLNQVLDYDALIPRFDIHRFQSISTS